MAVWLLVLVVLLVLAVGSWLFVRSRARRGGVIATDPRKPGRPRRGAGS